MKLGVLEEVLVIKIYLNMNSTGPLGFLIQNKKENPIPKIFNTNHSKKSLGFTIKFDI